MSSSVTVDVQTAVVTEELVTEEVVVQEEAVVVEKAVVEKVPPRLEEHLEPQALKEGETLVLSCKVSGQFYTYCLGLCDVAYFSEQFPICIPYQLWPCL